MFCISPNQCKESQEVICNIITKRNCKLKEVNGEKTALIKQLQQLAEEKNKLQHQLQAKKGTDKLCEHTSGYMMETEEQTEELKLMIQRSEELDIEWYVHYFMMLNIHI